MTQQMDHTESRLNRITRRIEAAYSSALGTQGWYLQFTRLSDKKFNLVVNVLIVILFILLLILIAT